MLTDQISRAVDRRGTQIALWSFIVGAVVVFGFVRPAYPNYDSFYALVWGREIAHGHLPDFNVFRTPTPHPLFNAYGALLSLTGTHAIRIMSVLSGVMYVALLFGIYRMVRLKIGALVAFVALLILLTRTDLMGLAFRSLLDVPFLNLLVWAAVLELKQPRRGTAPLVLLSLAGLLRPEAWLLAGVYWLWLALGVVRPELTLPGTAPSRRRLLVLALFVVGPPLVWMGLDWWIAGDPFYSFVSTREVAGDLARQKSLFASIKLLPRFAGGNEAIVNTTMGFVGGLFAIYVLRSRMIMLSLLALSGIATYLLIAIGGLSVISRYLLLPSMVACIGVAFALAGWVQLSGSSRRIGIGIALATLALMGVRLPAYEREFRQFDTESSQVSSRFGGIASILRDPLVAADARACRPLLAPTHEAVPVVRYLLDLGKRDVVASTQTHSPPTRGVQMLQSGYFDPIGQTSVSHTQRKPWTVFPLQGFAYGGENSAWLVFSSC